MQKSRSLVSLISLASSVLVCACTNSGADIDSASGAIDSTDSTESEGNVMMGSVDGADGSGLTGATAADIAIRIAANVSLRWNPTACATVTHHDAVVSIAFNDCTGPRGLVHVTGNLDLAVSVSAGGDITIHGTSTSLQVNRAQLVIDATATYTTSGTGHTLVVKTDGSGTGPRGIPVEHDGNYTITWDPSSQCRSIDGHWQTDVADRERANDVSLHRCGTGCPTGTITHHLSANASITITLDGTATAHWSSSLGATGTTQLSCQ